MKSTCTYCGAELKANEKFCSCCGMETAAGTANATPIYTIPTTPIPTRNVRTVKKTKAPTAALAIIVGAVIVTTASGITVANVAKNNDYDYSEEYDYDYDYDYDYGDNKSISPSVLEKMQETGVFTPGTYEVGTEIPAGEYILIANTTHNNPEATYTLYADSAKKEKLSGDWYQYSRIVLLEEGTYFDFSWATCYDLSKNTVPNDPFAHSGMFCVGRDIEPGTYKMVPLMLDEYYYSSEYAVLTKLGTIAPIIKTSGSFKKDGSVEIELEEGDYFYMKDAVLEK